MRELVLFSDLSPEEFALIRRPIDERCFGRGETLFRAGDSPQYVYTVREGLVKLEQYLPDGTQRIVRLARPGDLISLETLLGSP
jgi:CRP-like cAMP-binding protein